MRILLVVPMVPQREGAGAVPSLLHAQVAGLSELHDVMVLGTFGDLAGQAEAAEALRGAGLDARFVDRRRSRSPARRWRVRAELASRWARGGWPWRVVSAAGGMQPVLDDVLRTERFDLVALEDTPMSVLGLPDGLPVVLTEHEAVRAPGELWRSGGAPERLMAGLRRRDWRRWDAFQARAWRGADLVQVYSRGDAEAIAARAPDLASRTRVNPFGLVLPQPADPEGEEPGMLLFTGTFTHLPNRDAAVWLAREILPRVALRRPEARLRIVGKGMPSAIRGLAGERIEVIADAPSVRPHIEAASLILAPVRAGGGMRMKVLEGMAAGKAVVTTSLGAQGFDVFSAEPPLVVAEGAEGQAERIAALLEDRERRARLGRDAREFAERHHSPGAWAKRLTEVYEEAAARRATAAS